MFVSAVKAASASLKTHMTGQMGGGLAAVSHRPSTILMHGASSAGFVSSLAMRAAGLVIFNMR
jgi:hypothetical protein